eukprot:SAG11_NODE_4400_length_1911_cov_1.211369_3_plen_49_part_00
MLAGARAEALWMVLGARGAGYRTLRREQLRGTDAVINCVKSAVRSSVR